MLRDPTAPVVSMMFLVLALSLRRDPVVAQNPIHFGPLEFQNNFPQNLTFQVTVSSDEGDIIQAELFFAIGNEISSISRASEVIEFEPAAEVDLTYIWDTNESTIVPGTPIFFYWQVTDSAGNMAQSEEAFIRYIDKRFDWQILEAEDIGVWWHDRPESFGKSVFAIAKAAVEQQSELYQSDLDYQIVIIIYNDAEEFNAWQGITFDWIGGQAFPDFGITTQIVPSSQFQNQWLGDVIPHEISHLYFAQVTYSLISSVPTWLDEGVAQYNEFDGNELALESAISAAVRGDLVPLSTLESGFGSHNEERLRLAYDEAFSAVTYIVGQYGSQGLVDLLSAYRRGLFTGEAMEEVFRRSMGEFESDWATWLGAPENSHITPTPWPIPTFLPSPTPWIVTNSTPDSQTLTSPTPPETIAQIVATSSPYPTSPPKKAIDVGVAPDLPEGTPAGTEQNDVESSGICLFTPLLILGTIGYFRRRRKRSWR